METRFKYSQDGTVIASAQFSFSMSATTDLQNRLIASSIDCSIYVLDLSALTLFKIDSQSLGMSLCVIDGVIC